MTKLNARSLSKLEGVHDDLVRVVTLAREKTDFLVTEGLRTVERQKELVKNGKSQTMNSRHLYGYAVDLCDCDGCYDVPDMQAIARAMKSAAAELDIPIKWGGDWKSFKDTPHFELDRAKYPDKGDKKPKVVAPATAQAAKGAAIGATGGFTIPQVPAPPVDMVSGVADWQKAGETLMAAGKSPALYIVLCGILIAVIAPMIRDKFARG